MGMALFSGFDVIKKMVDAIQLDRYIGRQLKLVRHGQAAGQIDRKILRTDKQNSIEQYICFNIDKKKANTIQPDRYVKLHA